MGTTLTMPKLGLTMAEGTVVKWLIQDGEPVQQGQPLVVVMSKKITNEVEAPASGIVRIVAQPKETRKVTEVIGFILEPGEPLPAVGQAPAPPPAEKLVAPAETAPAPSPVAAAAPGEAPREIRSSPAARRLARELGVDIGLVQGSGRGGRISEVDVQRYHDERPSAPALDEEVAMVTPLARRMAEEEGLELAQIAGTGHDGCITEDDVLRTLEGQEETPSILPSVMPFTGMRQAIAEAMMASLHASAQLTLTSHADVTSLMELRDLLRLRWQVPVTYTDLIVKAVAAALRQHPLLNSTLVGEEIVLQNDINIGVAVALPQGLIVPVVRGVDETPLPDLHHSLNDMAERARQQRLLVDEVTGGTFTVTNLGMYGVEAFTPIINPPEVAILGVGGISPHLVLANGQVAERSRMALSLTIDHRIVDGAPGAAFLQSLVQLLEHPALIFAEGPGASESEGAT